MLVMPRLSFAPMLGIALNIFLPGSAVFRFSNVTPAATLIIFVSLSIILFIVAQSSYISFGLTHITTMSDSMHTSARDFCGIDSCSSQARLDSFLS